MAEPWRPREVLLTAVGTSALLVLLVATANTGPSLVNDTRAAAVASWSLGDQGQLALPEPWPASANYWGVETAGGRVHVNRFPGVAYWAAPAYAARAAVTGEPAPAHPFLIDLRPAAWTAAATVAAAVLALHVLLRRVVPVPWAAAGALSVGLGTGLWSVAADALWPHGPTALALVALLLGWRWRSAPLVLVASGLAVLVRPHLVVVPLVIGAYVLRRERDRVGAAAIVGGVVGLLVLSLYTWQVFGTWTPTAGYDVDAHVGRLLDRSVEETLRSFVLALVGTERGLLVWSPFLVVAAGLAVAARRQLPAWTVVSAVAGVAYLVVQVRSTGHLGGGDFFAPRISLESVVLAAPLLTVGAERAVTALAASGHVLRARVATSVLAVVAAGSIGWHAYGAVARSTSPHQVERWEAIDASVRRSFGDLELGDVDLREDT